MPLSVNICHIAGTITRKPDVKYTPKGTAVCEIGLAVNETWKDDKGDKHEAVTFINAEAWGKTAEIIGEYCDKGHTIFIESRVKQETWDDKTTGQKRSKLKFIVEKMHFVSKPKAHENEEEEQRAAPAKKTREQPSPKNKPAHDPDLDAEDEDFIPY